MTALLLVALVVLVGFVFAAFLDWRHDCPTVPPAPRAEDVKPVEFGPYTDSINSYHEQVSRDAFKRAIRDQRGSVGFQPDADDPAP